MIKRLPHLGLCALLGLVLLLPACTINDATPNPEDTMGDLVVAVVGGPSGVPLVNAEVSVHLSLEDVDRNIPFRFAVSARSGEVVFRDLLAGHYYVWVTWQDNNQNYSVVQPVQVVRDREAYEVISLF